MAAVKSGFTIVYVEYSVYIVFVCNINRKYEMWYRILNLRCFHLALSKSIILPDYLTSDLAFEKRLINVWPTLATFNRRWVNVYLQRSFNVLLLTLDKLSKNDVPETFTQRKN